MYLVGDVTAQVRRVGRCWPSWDRCPRLENVQSPRVHLAPAAAFIAAAAGFEFALIFKNHAAHKHTKLHNQAALTARGQATRRRVSSRVPCAMRHPRWHGGCSGVNCSEMYLSTDHGLSSPGRQPHSDAALSTSFVILCTKHTGRRQGDVDVYGQACPGRCSRTWTASRTPTAT